MSTDDTLTVRTHVGRDLLQTSQLFRTLEAAVWEYVANGLEYMDPGIEPQITVALDNRNHTVVVTDNGRGMDLNGLKQFFTMHGENVDRKGGKRGRGKFGTGKSAAFGIAKSLRVATTKNGALNVVELRIDDVKASDGDEIPIHWVEKDVPTTQPNGTVITIGDVVLPRLQPEPLIKNVERHLAFWRAANPTVYVGAHRCEPWQPVVSSTHTFKPTPDQSTVLGEVTLTVQVAQGPLTEGLYGIAITTAPGVLVAIETAGVESKEFGAYLFGDVEVPSLDNTEEGLAAYDLSRSLKLNPGNPVAATLIGFIGASLESVRRQLVDENKKLRQEHAYRQLEAAAAKIAELLNEDLTSVSDRLADVQALRRRAGNVGQAGTTGGGEEATDWAEGDAEPGLLDPGQDRGGSATPHDGDDPGLSRRGHPDTEGSDRVSPRGGDAQRPRPRGGLRVEYRNLGIDEDRSVYDESAKEILINLDHPMVAAAMGLGGVEDIAFKRLSYEVAFGQYALAVSQEFLKRDPDLTADDVLYEVRDALRRITRRAADLYGAVGATA
jgi:hypothetical protein